MIDTTTTTTNAALDRTALLAWLNMRLSGGSMSESTTTTNAESDRADILTRLDERIGNAIERAVQAEDIPQPVARSIRRNKIRDIGDSVIEAKRLMDAADAAQR